MPDLVTLFWQQLITDGGFGNTFGNTLKIRKRKIRKKLYKKKENRKLYGFLSGKMVGVAGLEPAASWSRTKRDTKLRHTPI